MPISALVWPLFIQSMWDVFLRAKYETARIGATKGILYNVDSPIFDSLPVGIVFNIQPDVEHSSIW